MKELDLQAKSSKSLLANVLDMDDDFRLVGSNIRRSNTSTGSQSALCITLTLSGFNHKTISGVRARPELTQILQLFRIFFR